MEIDPYILAHADDAAALAAYVADADSRIVPTWYTAEGLLSALGIAYATANDPQAGVKIARRVLLTLADASAADPVIETALYRLRNSDKGLNVGDPITLLMLAGLAGVVADGLTLSDVAAVRGLVSGPTYTIEQVAARRAELVREAAAKALSVRLDRVRNAGTLADPSDRAAVRAAILTEFDAAWPEAGE